MDGLEIPVSKIQHQTYKLIHDIGFDNVRMRWERTLETPLDHRGVMMQVCDAPILDPDEYKWLHDTLKAQRSKDKEALRERNIRWHQMREHPHHEPENCTDFQRRKRDDKAQHHRARRDGPTNDTYGNTPSAGPSGLTTRMLSRPNPLPESHHWHQAYEAASPDPTLALAARDPRWFEPPH
ncbi:hypothetical protein IW262DRAFT_1468812 [Armillaria fumosa]|nr:hypothetical protein IW262DRAFT_1468812 [Armillaria fumosa]